METIDRIRQQLSCYPAVRFSEAKDSITVHPVDDSGFIVSLRITARAFLVHFDGWHEEFTAEEEALECFTFGLSSSCRLAVVLRGRRAVRWTVESLEDQVWIADSETGLLLQPFWRSARTVYRQNHFVAAG